MYLQKSEEIVSLFPKYCSTLLTHLPSSYSTSYHNQNNLSDWFCVATFYVQALNHQGFVFNYSWQRHIYTRWWGWCRWLSNLFTFMLLWYRTVKQAFFLNIFYARNLIWSSRRTCDAPKRNIIKFYWILSCLFTHFWLFVKRYRSIQRWIA